MNEILSPAASKSNSKMQRSFTDETVKAWPIRGGTEFATSKRSWSIPPPRHPVQALAPHAGSVRFSALSVLNTTPASTAVSYTHLTLATTEYV